MGPGPIYNWITINIRDTMDLKLFKFTPVTFLDVIAHCCVKTTETEWLSLCNHLSLLYRHRKLRGQVINVAYGLGPLNELHFANCQPVAYIMLKG